MFNSIGRSSNFAQAGKSAADETVRAFAASRRNSPKYGELAQKAANIRSKEKIAAMKAEQEVAMAGIRAKSNVTTSRIKTDAKMDLDKSKRKAGALAAAGKLLILVLLILAKSVRNVKLVQRVDTTIRKLQRLNRKRKSLELRPVRSI